MKPNFLVIGAPRSGTTWIARNLMVHPDVFIPRAKEVHYFDRHFDRGDDFYSGFFHSAAGAPLIGDVTPDYLACEPCPARIRESLGEIKLIATLRNPADRLYSRYWNAEGKPDKRTGRTFEERMTEVPSWTTEGYYDQHLQRFLEYFSRDSLLVLLYDELQNDPETYYRKILEFLGADTSFVPETVRYRINAAGGKPRNAKSTSLYWLHRATRRIGLKTLSSAIDAVNTKPLPKMAESTRSELLNTVYGESICNLERLLDADLSVWRN